MMIEVMKTATMITREVPVTAATAPHPLPPPASGLALRLKMAVVGVRNMAAAFPALAARGLLRSRTARHIVFATCCFHSSRAVSPCFVPVFYQLIPTSNDERVSISICLQQGTCWDTLEGAECGGKA